MRVLYWLLCGYFRLRAYLRASNHYIIVCLLVKSPSAILALGCPTLHAAENNLASQRAVILFYDICTIFILVYVAKVTEYSLYFTL